VVLLAFDSVLFAFVVVLNRPLLPLDHGFQNVKLRFIDVIDIWLQLHFFYFIVRLIANIWLFVLSQFKLLEAFVSLLLFEKEVGVYLAVGLNVLSDEL